MKTFFLIFLALIFSSYGKVFSVETPQVEIVESFLREIRLHGKFGDRIVKSKIPDQLPVKAFIESNNITIYFDSFYENEVVTVSVQNEYSQIVAKEVITIDTSHKYSLWLDRVEGEMYFLEIVSKDGYLSGEF